MEETYLPLHLVFDEQITPWCMHNGVCDGRAVYRNPDLALHRYPDPHFIVGYQDAPDEVIIAREFACVDAQVRLHD